MTDEIIPAKEIKDILIQAWSETNVARPKFIDLGSDGTTLRIDLDRLLFPTQGKQDLIVVYPGGAMIEEPIGNWTYAHRTYFVNIDLYSLASRQRLYNLMAEIRRILHFKMHSTVGFQRVQFKSYNEEYEDNLTLWLATIEVELLNSAILMETTI